MIRRIREYTDAEQQKISDIETSLPSWTQVSSAIDNAITDTSINRAALRTIIKKLARVVYWLAKK